MRPGWAVDHSGRAYAVPIRAGLKEAVGWRAAPRPATTRPVAQVQAPPAAVTPSQNPHNPATCPTCKNAQTQLQPIPGPAGPAGPQGPAGPAGEVDYARIENMVTAVVSQSMTQLEDRLLERMANDPRFRGPAGPAGPPGPKGDQGSIPPVTPASDVWSHLVLIRPAQAEYSSRLEPLAARAAGYYNGLKVVEPPTDRNIGPLPVLVAYHDGSPVRSFVGPRAVEEALVALTRGDYDRFLEKE